MLTLLASIVLMPGPFPLDDCSNAEPLGIPGIDFPMEDPGISPLEVCRPVETPPPDIVGDAPLEAGVPVATVDVPVVTGGAV